jgi:predicted permease
MEIAQIAGRDVAWSDREGSPGVVVVNRAFADRFFASQNPLGERFRLGSKCEGGEREVEIAGVVADSRYSRLRGNSPATVYVPYRQDSYRRFTFVVRTNSDPSSTFPSIRAAISQIDPNVPITAIQTQAELVYGSAARERAMAEFTGLFAAAALLVACAGIYGTVAFTINRRTSEIGIRMALGAGRSSVIYSVMRGALMSVAAGVLLGIVVSAGAGRLVRGMLYGVQPIDPLTFLVAAVLFFATAAIAAFLPARRASRVDPLVALRAE